jgi:solute:Na+ symporter, SSS family
MISMFSALVIVTCIAYIIIALRFRTRTEELDDYFISNRTLTLQWEFASFYAAGLSLATVFIAFLEVAPYLGIQILWSPITYISGFFIISMLTPFIIRRTNGKLTLHGFLGHRYQSPTTQFVASTVSTVAFGGRFAAELIVGTQILQFLVPNPFALAMASAGVAIIVVVCTVIGGFRSVVATDRLQAVFVFLSCITLFLMSIYISAEVSNSSNEYIPRSQLEKPFFAPLLIINFFLINIPTVVVDMSVWQRLNAAESIHAAKGGVSRSAALFVISWTLVAISALSLSAHIPSSNGAVILISAFNQMLNMGAIQVMLTAVTLCGLIAAMLSSADTYLIATSQTFVMDLLKMQERSGSRNPSTIINTVRLTMVAGAIVFFCFVEWLFSNGINIAGIIFIIYGTLLALFPATIVGVLLPERYDLSRLKFACLTSVTFGFLSSWAYGIAAGYSSSYTDVSAVLSLFDFLPFPHSPFNTPIVALIGSTGIFLIMSLITLAIRGSMIRNSLS